MIFPYVVELDFQRKVGIMPILGLKTVWEGNLLQAWHKENKMQKAVTVASNNMKWKYAYE